MAGTFGNGPLFQPKGALVTQFSVSLSDPSNAAGPDANNIISSAQTAADIWAGYIQGAGSININVQFANESSETIAEGGSDDITNIGSDNGIGRYQEGTVAEIRNGTDPAGDPNITVTVNASFIKNFSYGSGAVPSHKVDAVSVFLHEIGHGLGFNSLLNSGGTNNGYELDSDKYVVANNGSPYFDGPNSSTAYNGGPLPLAPDGSFAHLGIEGDAMYPEIPAGVRNTVSDYDLAYLQDVGVPIATNRADILSLGSADDTFKAYGGSDSVSGGLGSDMIYGNQGTDLIYGNQGSDRLFGGQDDDRVYGGQDNDAVYGNLGNDAIYGNFGDDKLFGGQGDDRLFGGKGDDTLVGGLGNDTLVGGLGANTFIFGQNSGNDLIKAFDAASGDRIDLQGQSDKVAAASDGSALITLSGGGTIDLEGVTASQVNASFFTSASA